MVEQKFYEEQTGQKRKYPSSEEQFDQIDSKEYVEKLPGEDVVGGSSSGSSIKEAIIIDLSDDDDDDDDEVIAPLLPKLCFLLLFSFILWTWCPPYFMYFGRVAALWSLSNLGW